MMSTPNTIRQIAHADAQIGDVLLIGRFGGAYCDHYRVTALDSGYMDLVRVVARSVKNDDGTFSSVWEIAA